MPDSKISALTAVVTPATTDVFATVNAAVSKRVTLAQITAMGQWALLATKVFAGDVTYSLTGLAAYSEVRVILRNVTLSAIGIVQMRVSTDNGGTYLSAAGDYVGVTGAGVESNTTALSFYGTTATAARSSEIALAGFNLAAPKSARAIVFSVDSIGFQLVTTTTALNAIQILNSGAGNMSGGTAYVFGR